MLANVRPAKPEDHAAIWSILKPIFRAGDTYTIAPDISRTEAIAYWMGASHGCFVAEAGGQVLGTYYLKQNQAGGGSHVCNCGYATHPQAQGRGIARAMLTHSLGEARRQGFRAMQYNFVVETNTRAIETWERAGFAVVGRLPGAFNHPTKGFTDALVMYKDLTKED
jgi:ribosomal protein S18 acetylase RimI-like enzyme